MIVSLVGRTMSGSVEFGGGRGAQAAGAIGLEAVMGDDGAFLGEALDVRGLLRQVAERDEEREIGVAMAGGLEHAVERRAACSPRCRSPTA